MLFQELEEVPFPTETEEIQERLQDPVTGELPENLSEEDIHPDYVWENHVEKVAEYGDLYVAIISYPFGSRGYYILDRADGRGFKIPTDEGNFHQFKNLMADMTEELGDCREEEIKDGGVQVDGSRNMRCKGCGSRFNVG